MKAASKRIMEEKALRDRFPFKGQIKILAGMDLFNIDEVLSKLKQTVVKPLEGLRVVPSYGCLAVRPVDVVEPEDPENPMQMDHVLEAMGAEVLNWPYKRMLRRLACSDPHGPRAEAFPQAPRYGTAGRSGRDGHHVPHVPGKP